MQSQQSSSRGGRIPCRAQPPCGGFSQEAHLIQRGQERAKAEGSKYDGEVVLREDMGLAVFPSSARLGLLGVSRRGGSKLGLFFDVGHVPVRVLCL